MYAAAGHESEDKLVSRTREIPCRWVTETGKAQTQTRPSGQEAKLAHAYELEAAAASDGRRRANGSGDWTSGAALWPMATGARAGLRSELARLSLAQRLQGER